MIKSGASHTTDPYSAIKINKHTTQMNLKCIMLSQSSQTRRFTFCMCSVAQLYPTLYGPMDCSPPGSSVHGILQARILEWVATSFSRPCAQRWRLLGRLCWFSGPVSLEGLLGPSTGRPKSSFGIFHHKEWLIWTNFWAKPRFCETSWNHAQHPPGCLRRGFGGPEMCQQDVCASTA